MAQQALWSYLVPVSTQPGAGDLTFFARRWVAPLLVQDERLHGQIESIGLGRFQVAVGDTSSAASNHLAVRSPPFSATIWMNLVALSAASVLARS